MNDYKALLMDVQRSIRYHDRRQGFYQAILGVSQFIILMFGTATVATFGAKLGEGWPEWVRLAPSVLASALVAAMLVFRFGDKAWLHMDLKRDFIRLEQRLELMRHDHAPEQVSQVQADRLAIEVREPKVLRVLDTICHNDVMRAMGYGKDDLIAVGWFQKMAAPFFDFKQETLHGETT